MSPRYLASVTASVVTAVVLAGTIERRVAPASAVSKLAASCPTKLLPLGANPVEAASHVALRAERARDLAQVTGAVIATLAFDRSHQVVHNCGSRVAARSVVVTIHRRAYDRGPNKSASLSQGTIVLGRFKSGWRVWDVLH